MTENSNIKLRSANLAWSEALAASATIEQLPQRLLADIILERATSDGDLLALLSDTKSFTFSELAARIYDYQAWAMAQGLVKGSCVGLVMGNRPDMVAAWLGLSRAGVVVALLNPSLKHEALAHAVALAAPSHLVVDPAFESAIHDAGISIAICAAPERGKARPSSCGVSIKDTALLIYTSGTTGLPKAAKVSHARVLNWALWFMGLLGNTKTDRIYNCLPLYHSVGGIVAVAATLAAGGSTVIAPKFSASQFWPDIRRWQCTQFQYIGELCRYLLAQPVSDLEGGHQLRLAVGNGLRGDIGVAFQERFAIPQIIEFYAATEGTFSLYNVQGPMGSIGRIPPFLRHRFKIALVQHDVETGLPKRNSDGTCAPVATGEVGEAIGYLPTDEAFEGYTGPDESERKILRDVFERGDRWFRTGDLMRMDKAGNYFFVDRIGDTYRWKGENVSTLEVATVIVKAAGVKDAVVYGVQVPGADGRAGMACLETTDDFDIERFHSVASAALPNYAVPVFLRLANKTVVTETFKHKKNDLAQAGFDPSFIADRLFVRIDGVYRRLDDEMYRAIISEQVKL